MLVGKPLGDGGFIGFTRYRQPQSHITFRIKFRFKPGDCPYNRAGRRRAFNSTSANDAVQPFIRQDDVSAFNDGIETPAFLLPYHAPHLENVGKVGFELKRKREIERNQTVISHPQPLITPALPEKHRKRQMHSSSGYDNLPARIDVLIRQIDGQQGVVIRD
jgi:hypothetical protein